MKLRKLLNRVVDNEIVKLTSQNIGAYYYITDRISASEILDMRVQHIYTDAEGLCVCLCESFIECSTCCYDSKCSRTDVVLCVSDKHKNWIPNF